MYSAILIYDTRITAIQKQAIWLAIDKVCLCLLMPVCQYLNHHGRQTGYNAKHASNPRLQPVRTRPRYDL